MRRRGGVKKILILEQCGRGRKVRPIIILGPNIGEAQTRPIIIIVSDIVNEKSTCLRANKPITSPRIMLLSDAV